MISLQIVQRLRSNDQAESPFKLIHFMVIGQGCDATAPEAVVTPGMAGRGSGR